MIALLESPSNPLPEELVVLPDDEVLPLEMPFDPMLNPGADAAAWPLLAPFFAGATARGVTVAPGNSVTNELPPAIGMTV